MKKRLLKKELKFYKEKLLEFREEIMQEVRKISEDVIRKSPIEASGDLSSHTFHIADVASDNFERDVFLNLASSEMDLVREIDSALARIEEGSYGFCEACNNPIPKQRLKAIPYVRLCKKCQEKLEKQA